MATVVYNAFSNVRASELLGFDYLSEAEHTNLYVFMLLWMRFEAVFCDCNANKGSILRIVNCPVKLDDEFLHDEFYYFRSRYTSDGDVNDSFKNLTNVERDRRYRAIHDCIRKIIMNDNPTVSEKVKACLLIVYRIRNNLFHGEKFLYEFSDQNENFRYSICVLEKIILRYDVCKDVNKV